MAGTVLICKLKMIQFASLLYPRQPVFDNNIGTAMEYFTHFLLAGPAGRFLNEQSLAPHFGKALSPDWLHEDFLRLKNDLFHRAFGVGEAAQELRERGWL